MSNCCENCYWSDEINKGEISAYMWCSINPKFVKRNFQCILYRPRRIIEAKEASHE